MLVRSGLPELIQRIYSGVADPKGLYALARELTDAFECAPALLLVRLSAEQHRPPMGIALDALPPFQERWTASLEPLSAWRQAARAQAPGSVARLEALVPGPALRASHFYRRWMRPQGLATALQLALSRENGNGTFLLLFRSAGAQPFSGTECDLLEGLAPHLDQALRIRSDLEAAAAVRRSAFEALDHARIGLILLDGEARIVGSNSTGDHLLRLHDGLAMDREGLHAASPDETKRLRQLIAEAVRCGRGGDLDGAGFLSLSRPSGARPLLVAVRPLSVNGEGLASEFSPGVGVFVRDPDTRMRVSTETLQALFAFTRAEARVASLLVAGSSLNRIAVELGRSRHTVRNELKRLFAKTGTNRQSDLTRLLSFAPSAGEDEVVDESSPQGDTDLI